MKRRIERYKVERDGRGRRRRTKKKEEEGREMRTGFE
jgi:hypothetical protein